MGLSLRDPVDENPTLSTTPQVHLAQHKAFARATNFVTEPVRLAWNIAGIDTGVVIFTPDVGDRIMGLFVEFNEAFNVTNEMLGLCVPGTTDADLALPFRVDSMPASTPTFEKINGLGVGFGLAALRLTEATPIRARTKIGGNTQGSIDIYVMLLRGNG